jgi:hypothetical protein
MAHFKYVMRLKLPMAFKSFFDGVVNYKLKNRELGLSVVLFSQKGVVSKEMGNLHGRKFT